MENTVECKGMKFLLFFYFASLLGCTSSVTQNSTDSIFPLTKNKIRNLLQNPPADTERLKEETVSGCISVPARDFFQRLFVGSESTGESCSITVHSNNEISVSFLSQKNIPFISTSRPDTPTDTFTAELDNGQVLIVQHKNRRVVSFTQTVYDQQGMVVYQGYGDGNFIRVCLPYMTDSEKRSGRCHKTP